MAGLQTVPSELKSFLRSVLVSSNGVKESKVERDYRELAGERLDWIKLGFKSLREFLCAVPDVCRLQYSTKDKENRVYAVEVKGIYMSSHAKKNVKSASNVQLAQSNTDTTPPSLMPPSGRRVQQDGVSLKITVGETWGGNEMLPNKSGFYQVYVANLPPDCTESDLKISFSKYGDVKEAYIVISSRNQKYASKQEALRALMEGKNTPPVIRGQSLDVGEAKCKNVNDVETSVNAVLNYEPKHGINILPPISTQISTPSSPKRSLAYEQPQKTPSALSVFKNDMQDKHFSVGGSAETLNQPLFSVNISGYINQKMKEADLRMIFQNVGHIEQFEYHPLYSIVKFKTRNEAMNALSSVNGMFVGATGSALFVTALSWPVEEPTVKSKPDELERNDKTEAKTKLNEAKKDKVKGDEITRDEVNKDEVEEDKISEIYNLYSEAIVRCCGQSYQEWLNTLPPVFGMEVMEVIDPCTFWARISDGTTTHEQFNDLINRLQFIDPLSNKKLLERNEFGIGQFSEDDEWYRCYCYDVSPNGKHLRVMYIDYGNCEWLERDKVVRLPPAFLQLQPQGVLVKLSGLRYKLNEKSVNSSALLYAKQLLMGGQSFKARKASLDPTKPLLLEVEILQSEGEAIYKKLSCQPGIEVTPRSASPPVQHLLLSSPPLPPDNLQPLKKGLVVVKSDVYYIWITHITSQTTFYFQLVNAVSREAISAIQEYLSKCDLQNKINIRNIKGETLVCYHRNGRERSRVQLLTSSHHIVPGQVSVLHVDIGKEAMVPCTSFISLPLGANKFPYQARPATLYNVPDLVYSQSSAALDFIIQQSNKVLRANVVAENRDESVIVELFDFNGESINKQMLEIISNEHATHAQARNPGGRALSNKNSSISNDTVQSHIKALMKLKISPPQDSLTVDTSFSVMSRESTSRQSTPTDIAGAQGNRNGFKKVSPEEKPFDGTAGKHVFPRPNLASSQNHVSSQSAWNLGSSSQYQISSTCPSKLGPNGQNQDIPTSPSKFASSSQNRDISTSPSKLGPNGQNQDILTSPSKFGSSSQNRDILTSSSKLGSKSLNQDFPTSPSKFGSSSQNRDIPTSSSKLGSSALNRDIPTSSSKLGSSSQNRDIPTSSSKLGSSSQNRDIPTFPTSLSKFASSSQSHDISTSPSKLGPNSSIQVSPTSPSKFGPSSQNHVGPTSFSKFGHSDQNHISPPFSKAGFSIKNQIGNTFPPNAGPVAKTNSNSSPSPLFGEPKTNVPIQVAKKAEALSKTPTGNTKASQSNVENQTSPFTLKQGSLSASSSPAFGKPNQTNLQNQASAFLLKQGNPVETLVTPTTTTNSLNSTTKSPTVVDCTEGSKSSVKTKQQNTKNSKSSYDEKPANEKQVPMDLPPIKYVTSGGRNVSLPTLSNAQKNACGSAKGRRRYNDSALASKVIGYGELKKKIEEQERILSRSASEQRHQLVQRKIKEKLEVQLRIKKLEKAVFALQNEIQSLNLENDTLEKQLHQK